APAPSIFGAQPAGGENRLIVDQFPLYSAPLFFRLTGARVFMKLIVKVFPEITIKSPPVRKGFIRQLAKNIRTVLRDLDPELRVEGVWDNIEVETALGDTKILREMIERLRCTPGLAHCLVLHECALGDLDDIFEKCKAHFAVRMSRKIFAVRCKRAGKHPFSSMDVERHVGSRLREECGAAGISLKAPEI